MGRHPVPGRPGPTFAAGSGAGCAGAGHYRELLVPAVGVLLPPCPVRGPVPVLDVAHAPADLGACVPLPARSRAGHLAARNRLRDAVSARIRVGRVTVPPAFDGP